jgi:hypothetical protein
MGISFRDDLLERGNNGTGWIIGGFVLGHAFAFAGGNIGDGPGWWVVLFAVGLASGTLALIWWLIGSFTSVADHITIDRDPAPAIRMGGFFAAAGLMLGRAVAGDWESASATVEEFVSQLGPVVLLGAIAFVSERFSKPDSTGVKPLLMRAWVPALAYVLVAIITLLVLGAAI